MLTLLDPENSLKRAECLENLKDKEQFKNSTVNELLNYCLLTMLNCAPGHFLMKFNQIFSSPDDYKLNQKQLAKLIFQLTWAIVEIEDNTRSRYLHPVLQTIKEAISINIESINGYEPDSLWEAASSKCSIL